MKSGPQHKEDYFSWVHKECNGCPEPSLLDEINQIFDEHELDIVLWKLRTKSVNERIYFGSHPSIHLLFRTENSIPEQIHYYDEKNGQKSKLAISINQKFNCVLKKYNFSSEYISDSSLIFASSWDRVLISIFAHQLENTIIEESRKLFGVQTKYLFWNHMYGCFYFVFDSQKDYDVATPFRERLEANVNSLFSSLDPMNDLFDQQAKIEFLHTQMKNYSFSALARDCYESSVW